MSKILNCVCKHPSQDEIHGKGNRVHNRTSRKSGDGIYVFRCTVCKAERNSKA